MDVHVVELKIDHPRSGLRPTDEAGAFGEAGVYERAGGTVSRSRPTLGTGEIAEDPIATLALINGRIADAVAAGFADGRAVVMAGGNCCALPGMIGGLQQAFGATARIGLVWFDAHGDFNTPRTTLSGMLGGMPVAVSAGLCYPSWRSGAHQEVSLPTDRIVMVDVRNLDPDEERLIRATDVAVVPIAGEALRLAVERLARECDLLYLHIDLDVLDERFTPSHRTKEPGGPDIEETLQAIQTVLDTGKVRAVGLVSIYPAGEGGDVSLASAATLLGETLARWSSARS
jgi:arginase